MEISPNSSSPHVKPRLHRSAVSNGKRLFAEAGADSRTLTGRRFRDLVVIMTNDLGGADLLSEFQKQLIRRAATLSVMAETMEADVVRELPCDLNNYGMIADRLRRLAETLGIRRVARDVGATLEQYLDAKYESTSP